MHWAMTGMVVFTAGFLSILAADAFLRRIGR